MTDFQTRVLTRTPTWVPLAETIALRIHTPLWNSKITGFGSKNQGAGRSGQVRSLWDTLHPRRSYAAIMVDWKEIADEIAQTAINHLQVFTDGSPES